MNQRSQAQEFPGAGAQAQRSLGSLFKTCHRRGHLSTARRDFRHKPKTPQERERLETRFGLYPYSATPVLALGILGRELL